MEDVGGGGDSQCGGVGDECGDGNGDECHQTKGLMSKKIDVHMHYKSLHFFAVLCTTTT